MAYFDHFAKENQKRLAADRLKVAVSFSVDTTNSDRQRETNENLHRAIQAYNASFGTAFDMTTVKAYTEDLARRLKKTADDGKALDLVIVVDQLLTGFDAPELNTLYIDRTLKGGNLIQAYSRTNRIHNQIAKPWGNVVNYRWPVQNEYEMNKAFAVYSNRASADVQMTVEELKEDNVKDGIIAKPFGQVQAELKEVIEKLATLTDDFVKLPPSEKAQDEVFENLQEYNRLLSQLKQYTEDDDKNPVSAYDNPQEFFERLGITEDQEVILTTVIADELKERRAQGEDIDISQVNLAMVHIHDVTINYDYLIDLIARMADEVHGGEMTKAETTRDEIHVEISKSDNDGEKTKVRNFVAKILSKEFVFDHYPAPRNVEKMNQAMERSQKNPISNW